MMTCKVIRIGVFFDGTGNNLFNDKAGKKESNIAKLYMLYTKLSEDGKSPCLFGSSKEECKIFTSAIYIEGVGTQAGRKKDDTLGLATGSGGAERIERAINQLLLLQKRFPNKEYKCYLDVFGFSRGAALARDFINTIQGNKRIKLNITIKFVGLFDTVGSFGKAGDNKNYKPISSDASEADTFMYEFSNETPPSDMYEPYNFNLSNLSAEKIVHLIALDEYRKNFPLTDTAGVGQTYTLIGAHSDVGGGYEPQVKEDLFEYSKDRIRSERLEKLKNPENGIVIGEEWKSEPLNLPFDYPIYERYKTIPKYSGLRYVSNDLQQVGLITMYNLAVRAGVPFLPFTLELSDSNLKKLTQEIAYSEYHLAFKPVDKHSQSLSSLLGESSHWSQELKEYCIEAMENPGSLSSYLGQVTHYLQAENEVNPQHHRSLLHLRILAKYAHNSSCTAESNGLKQPPIGFKHRSPTDSTESLSNSADYPTLKSEIAVPMRRLFNNLPNLAIHKK